MIRGTTFAALAALTLLAGCVTTADNKHLQPIPARLVAEMNAMGMSESDPIMVRIFKQESELELWKRDRAGKFALLKTYPMCRWSGQLGPKIKEGDRQAPEGFYTVRAQQLNPNSQYYLSYDLGFPNAFDRAHGRTGSALMVHGACTSAGCFAMTDEGVAELYAVAREALRGGQEAFQVQALPFRMTAENLARHRANSNIAFWRNLKEGVDHFDVARIPPKVAVCGRRYAFSEAPAGGSDGGEEQCEAPSGNPALLAEIAAKRQRDEARVAEVIARGEPAVRLAFADGSMHPSFRNILKTQGRDHLQRVTSGRVEISRPDAALAEPEVVALRSQPLSGNSGGIPNSTRGN